MGSNNSIRIGRRKWRLIPFGYSHLEWGKKTKAGPERRQALSLGSKEFYCFHFKRGTPVPRRTIRFAAGIEGAQSNKGEISTV